MYVPLKDEEIIRKAWDLYQKESLHCDELNSFTSACNELLRLERENNNLPKKENHGYMLSLDMTGCIFT